MSLFGLDVRAKFSENPLQNGQLFLRALRARNGRAGPFGGAKQRCPGQKNDRPCGAYTAHLGLLHGPQHENMHSPVDCRPWRLATLVNPIDHQWVQIRSKVEVSLPSTGCDSSNLELPWKHDAGDGVVCCQRFNPLLPDGGRTLSSQLEYHRPADNTPWHVPGHSFAARKPDPVAHRHGDGGIREYESVVDGDGSAYDESMTP